MTGTPDSGRSKAKGSDGGPLSLVVTSMVLFESLSLLSVRERLPTALQGQVTDRSQ